MLKHYSCLLISLFFYSLLFSQEDYQHVSSTEGEILEIYTSQIDNDCYLMSSFLDTLKKFNSDRKLIVYINPKSEKCKEVSRVESLQSITTKRRENLDRDNSSKSELKKNKTLEQKYISALQRRYSDKKTVLKFIDSDMELNSIYHGRWVQDLLISKTCKDEKKLFFLKGIKLRKSFENLKKININTKPIEVKGGNILFVDDLTFVGVNDKNDSTKKLFKNIVWVGTDTIIDIFTTNLKQPFFHIDMFLNVIKQKINNDSILLLLGKIYAANEEMSDLEQKMDTMLRLTENNLRSQLDSMNKKYIIDYLPLFILNNNNNKNLYSVNNAIIEPYKKDNYSTIMYMPYYKRTNKILRQKIVSTLIKYKIKPVFIGNEDLSFDTVINKRGSLHCMTKVLRRR